MPDAMRAALADVASRLNGAGVTWVLGGSAGRRLLGAVRDPRDLDLEVAVADVDVVCRVLGVVMRPGVDPDGRVSGVRGGTVVRGVEVDVSAGIVVHTPHGELRRADDALRAGAVTVFVDDVPVPVGAPEEGLVRALVRGDWERVARIASGGGPPPRPGHLAERLASIARR